MTTAVDTTPGSIMIDGVPLKDQLAKAERRKRITAFLLVAPLLAFIIFTFVIPIANMLTRSVENPRMTDLMPTLVDSFETWDGKELPPEEMYEIMFHEIQRNIESGDIGKRFRFADVLRGLADHDRQFQFPINVVRRVAGNGYGRARVA